MCSVSAPVVLPSASVSLSPFLGASFGVRRNLRRATLDPVAHAGYCRILQDTAATLGVQNREINPLYKGNISPNVKLFF